MSRDRTPVEPPEPQQLVAELRDMAERLNDLARRLAETHGIDEAEHG